LFDTTISVLRKKSKPNIDKKIEQVEDLIANEIPAMFDKPKSSFKRTDAGGMNQTVIPLYTQYDDSLGFVELLINDIIINEKTGKRYVVIEEPFDCRGHHIEAYLKSN